MSTQIFEPHDRQRLGLLLAAVTLVVIPHLNNLEPGILAFFALLMTWRTAVLLGKASIANGWLLFVLTIAGAALVYLLYERFYGREAGAALFMVGLGLKLMELKSVRDAYLVIFLASFVAVTQYLFSQSIPMAIYTLGIVVLLIASLIGFNSPESFGLIPRLKLATQMVVLALPLMLVLFVLFPRIPGPLWRLPDNQLRATTGLSDNLELGHISRLGLSQRPAFRVDFEGPPPPPSQRYWRGPVFWKTDGRRWSLADESAIPVSTPTWRSPVIRYTVTLEPHEQRWVLALDLPSAYPQDLRLSGDHLLLSKDKIRERARFRLESRTGYVTGPLSEPEKEAGLQLPKAPSPRMRALLDAWRSEATSPAQLAQRALRHFREKDFYYTLNPPSLGDDPVDEFLFDTRRGFCEHYATTFVVLMRAAGIPARVVTGYQGGTWNHLGRFLEVKQADAHAWAEVWLSEQGWVRVDPTAAVAPERIEHGVDFETQVAAGEVRFNWPDGENLHGFSGLLRFGRETRMLWNSLDHAWNQWVLAYGSENQNRLLNKLGGLDWPMLIGWLAIGLVSAGGLAAYWILPRRARQTDPVLRIYQRFLHKLARRGLTKDPTEGPSNFADRAASIFPEASRAIATITALYLAMRYGQQPGDRRSLRRFNRLVAAFKPS